MSNSSRSSDRVVVLVPTRVLPLETERQAGSRRDVEVERGRRANALEVEAVEIPARRGREAREARRQDRVVIEILGAAMVEPKVVGAVLANTEVEAAEGVAAEMVGVEVDAVHGRLAHRRRVAEVEVKQPEPVGEIHVFAILGFGAAEIDAAHAE